MELATFNHAQELVNVGPKTTIYETYGGNPGYHRNPGVRGLR